MEDKDAELRFVIRSDMTDNEIEEFAQEIKKEIQSHLLIGGEEVLTALSTDKISYESKQQMKELGVE